MTDAQDVLAHARAAFEAADWEEAEARYEAAAAAGSGAEALDGLSQVRYMQCRIDEAIELREQAFAAYRRQGDDPLAARCALWLTVEYGSARGADAVANGWYQRAESLLSGLPPQGEHVELEIQRARRAPSGEEADAHFARALEMARGGGSVDREVRALSCMGVAQVARGLVAEGMAKLDEAMAAVSGGELRDPWSIGGTYCQMLAACDTAGDWARAAEWCERALPATGSWVPLWAWCRSVYGGVLTAVGDWERAEQELLESLRTYGGAGTPMSHYPLARLAELRMRQGRYEEAERLIEGLDHHPRAAATGIALLLARGKPRAAAASARRRLERVGRDSPAAAWLLPLLVDAHVALGEHDEARRSARDLAELARTLGRADLTAAAELASASISQATGDGAAATHLDTALELYERLGMPLEAARARMGLAQVLLGEGDEELALEEARRALRSFERLGAAPDADAAAAMLRRLGAAGRTAPRLGGELTARELEVLALLGEGLSNAEIGRRLFISAKTAEHHVGRILRKLGLSARAEAAAHAARLATASSPSAARSR